MRSPQELHPAAWPHGPQSVELAQVTRSRRNVEPPHAQRPFMHFLNAVDTLGRSWMLSHKSARRSRQGTLPEQFP